ncbi:unnamed protein product [Phyllotreta striolata]|uniref:Clip domain-containing protein n=1 Tax=Phyllotreta striolata TaxID=444603 RepID=A0A9N9TTG5_PHYSR|nr:unnamed protein product [Phyllotreta striolata]
MMVKLQEKAVFLFSLTTIILISNCEARCNCQPLKQCPTFVNYLRSLPRPLQTDTVSYIRSQKCGYQDGFPKICCLNSYSNDKRRFSRRKLLQNSRCDSSSDCVVLPMCKTFMNFLMTAGKPLRRNVVSFLRRKECGFEKGYPKVCCGSIPNKMDESRRLEFRPRIEVNLLSMDDDGLLIPGKAEEDHFQFEPDTRLMKVTTERTEINGEYDIMRFLEYVDSVDFIARKKRSGFKSHSDVEIR